jgi:hypothetical protein
MDSINNNNNKLSKLIIDFINYFINIVGGIITIVGFVWGIQTLKQLLPDPTLMPIYPVVGTVVVSQPTSTSYPTSTQQAVIPPTSDPTYTPYPTQTPYPTLVHPTAVPPIVIVIPPTSVPPTAIPPTAVPPTFIPQITTFITVFANQAWQDTGITIITGEILTIKYLSGLWRWTGDRADFDGNGDPAATGRYLGTCDDCPIIDAPLEALIGKIGLNGIPFLIGNNINYVPNDTENNQKLFLMGNDGLYGLHDNVGSIEVSITK